MRRSVGFFRVGFVAMIVTACSGEGGDSRQALPRESSAIPNMAASMPERDMIVILRDQMSEPNRRSDERRVRSTAIAAAQAPLLRELQSAKPRQAHTFETVNGFATKLSPAEISRLSAHPQVLAVVPDRMIRSSPSVRRMRGAARAIVKPDSADAASLCNTLEPEALQLTNTAFLDRSVPQAQEVLDGEGFRVTGRGVKVGIISDGLDTSIAGFTRADGSKVFIDYQDFSGDPAGTPTSGGEMFGDASSIAAQDMPNGQPLTFDLGKYISSAHALPSPCNIRIRGMAPDASLAGMNIFGNFEKLTFASAMVEAIDWLVVHDEVDVINESIAYFPPPDDTADPISLANAAAARAGVTVVVATGDGGSDDTLGSPSTDASVVAVGAATQYRQYAQMMGGSFPYENGWLNGNISSMSSAGWAQARPRTVDLVAPGDGGWELCSMNMALYTYCVDFNGAATPIAAFGGTSEAAPITAGAAALVIQAYRSTHRGWSPSPALVKRILMSSASDLGAPSDEEGAGLVDSLKAVNTALSVHDENGVPAARGDGILATPSTVSFTAHPGDRLEQAFQITNVGAATLDTRPALEALGEPFTGRTFGLTLDPTNNPTYLDDYGAVNAYITQTFTVPEEADHLDAAIAWPGTVGGQQTFVDLLLLDPSGRAVAYSTPQFEVGTAYGHVDVVRPTPGAWTALIGTLVSDPATYSGAVQFTWSADRFVSVGKVSPSHLTLRAGESVRVVAELDAPKQPGDFAAAVRFHGPGDAPLSEIPFTTRTLVPTGRGGGVFSGTLTGGNGRAYDFPTHTYAFDVPAGLHDLGLTVNFADDGYLLAGYLVDPNGMILSSGSSIDPSGAQQHALQMFRASPQPGRWRFLLQEIQASGNQVSTPFTARVAFDEARVSAKGLPNSPDALLSASQPAIVVPLAVTNTGALAKAFFADARLTQVTDVALPQGSCGASNTLPGFCSFTVVVPHTSAVQFIGQSPAPITMTVTSGITIPDNQTLLAGPVTDGPTVASIHAPEVAFGIWALFPALVGPFGPTGAPTEPVTTSIVATMQPFDTTVAADSGNRWSYALFGTSYNPLVLGPGATGVISLTITPDPTQVGKTVTGSVYVDTGNLLDEYGWGDEVASLPYTYTVAR